MGVVEQNYGWADTIKLQMFLSKLWNFRDEIKVKFFHHVNRCHPRSWWGKSFATRWCLPNPNLDLPLWPQRYNVDSVVPHGPLFQAGKWGLDHKSYLSNFSFYMTLHYKQPIGLLAADISSTCRYLYWIGTPVRRQIVNESEYRNATQALHLLKF